MKGAPSRVVDGRGSLGPCRGPMLTEAFPERNHRSLRYNPEPERPMSDPNPVLFELSVVLPVWNGDHNLGRLLPRLSRVLEATVDGPCEILVALPPDDPVGPQVEGAGGRVVEFHGAGYGDALNAGLSAARGRWVVTMDADFSHHPEFIRTLWLRRGDGEVLIASRYVSGAVASMPLSRRILSRALK